MSLFQTSITQKQVSQKRNCQLEFRLTKNSTVYCNYNSHWDWDTPDKARMWQRWRFPYINLTIVSFFFLDLATSCQNTHRKSHIYLEAWRWTEFSDLCLLVAGFYEISIENTDIVIMINKWYIVVHTWRIQTAERQTKLRVQKVNQW